MAKKRYKMKNFQKDALRTVCDRAKEDKHAMLSQAIIGLTGEVGELATALERSQFYGHELDTVNIQEEIGDCLWYLAEMCESIGVSMQDVMENVIEKLQKRYPDKFDKDRAREENRDRNAERESFEDNHKDTNGIYLIRDDQGRVYWSYSAPCRSAHDQWLINNQELHESDLLTREVADKFGIDFKDIPDEDVSMWVPIRKK